MAKALTIYQKLTGVLAKAVLIMAATLIGLDVLSLFAEAVGRYLIGESRAFMEELPRLALPLVVFPMMGVLLKAKRHIGVDLLPERLPPRYRSLCLIAVYTVILAVAIQFLAAGIIAIDYYRAMGFETQSEIIFKVWVTYLPFPVGFGLLALFAIEMLWQELLDLHRLIKEGS